MNDKLLRQALDALIDYESAWGYIRESHGDLYGIRGDRAESRGSLAIADLKFALAQSEASMAKYEAYKAQKREEELAKSKNDENEPNVRVVWQDTPSRSAHQKREIFGKLSWS